MIENKFHPSHQLIIQAIILNDPNEIDIWKNKRIKTSGEMQTIQLELSTTIVDFENFSHKTEVILFNILYFIKIEF